MGTSPAKQRRLGPALCAAFPHTVPVLTGYLFLGIAYCVLMNAKGCGPVWSTLMSAVAFGGCMQFVAISLLTIAGGTALYMVLVQAVFA